MPTLSEKLGYSTDDVVYELDILFQSQLLGIFAHGIYTAVYIMALYQICTSTLFFPHEACG